ncbi:unnamed protein product [Psylliodes chrysocephalus]|uniref:Uncharacterized protein n=1 Tax=Psylliodes chrysocephalus TaxID=3402493 RepID=A0A9P0GBH7_9CUCU|nr:unnamed protein product [Psylliodes chrysocephala]
MHLNCTDLKADDRVTRQKLRCIKIVCNRSSSIVDQFSEVKGILETFKINIDKKVDSFDEKLKGIQNNIESFNNQLSEFKDQVKNSESVRSPEFIGTVTAEAVARMRRAKNILIRGVAEAQGDSAVKKEQLHLILTSVGSTAEMVSFYRIGKPNSNNKYPRMIKVTFQCESDEFYLQEHQKPSSSATKARAPYVYNRLSARTKLHPPDQKSRRVDTGCCDPKTPSIRSVVVADSAHVEAPPTSLPNSPPPP